MPVWRARARLPPPGGAARPDRLGAAGDSLTAIARRHGVPMEMICNYNSWPDCTDHLLLPGDEIRIPPDALVPADD